MLSILRKRRCSEGEPYVRAHCPIILESAGTVRTTDCGGFDFQAHGCWLRSSVLRPRNSAMRSPNSAAAAPSCAANSREPENQNRHNQSSERSLLTLG